MSGIRGVRVLDDVTIVSRRLGMDSFYTPQALADLLVSSCTSVAPSRIADFAAGDGALLKSALARWPDADVTGVDIDKRAIQALSERVPKASLLHQDFFTLREESDNDRRVESPGVFDVILLNPPFSCRGKTKVLANLSGVLVGGSRALAFVATALGYLRPDGELVAIVPSSCLTSERDSSLRRVIAEMWEMERIGGSWSSAFARCDVSVDIVRLTRRLQNSVPMSESRPCEAGRSRGRLQLMRGTVANAAGSLTPCGLQFVHSTDLLRGEVASATRWTCAKGRQVAGTAVLLPRVGRIKLSKLVFKSDPATIVLSDCVIALKTPDSIDERALYRLLSREWEDLRHLWTGSCAPYVTTGRLSAALEKLGYLVEGTTDMSSDLRRRRGGRSQRSDARTVVPGPREHRLRSEVGSLPSG